MNIIISLIVHGCSCCCGKFRMFHQTKVVCFVVDFETRSVLLDNNFNPRAAIALQLSNYYTDARTSLMNLVADDTATRFATYMGTIGDRMWLILIMRHFSP